MLRLIQPYLPLGLSGLMMCWMLENNNGCVFDKITKRYNFISKHVLHIHSFFFGGGVFRREMAQLFKLIQKTFSFLRRILLCEKWRKCFHFLQGYQSLCVEPLYQISATVKPSLQ